MRYYHPSPADIFSAYAQSSFPIAAQSELKYLAIYKQICLNYTQSLGDRPRCNFSYWGSRCWELISSPMRADAASTV